MLFFLAVGPIQFGEAQSTKPSRVARRASIKKAIAMLVEEAQQTLRDQKLAAATPDFARRFDGAPDALDLLDALTRPVHTDSFTDAYVRWQLTSFDPPLPALDDRQFLKLMDNAPAMMANPRSDPELVKLFQKAENTAKSSAREHVHLREASAMLDHRTQTAQAFNRPAEEYRDWVAGKLEPFPARRLQWLIERCAAAVSAGWSSRTIKARLTREFKAAGLDSTITSPQRQMLAEQARLLIGRKRVSINEVTFHANGSIAVTFTTSAIDKDDVDKWIELLNGGGGQ